MPFCFLHHQLKTLESELLSLSEKVRELQMAATAAAGAAAAGGTAAEEREKDALQLGSLMPSRTRGHLRAEGEEEEQGTSHSHTTWSHLSEYSRTSTLP